MEILRVQKSETKNMLDIYFSDNTMVTVYQEDYYALQLYDKKNFTHNDILEINKVTNKRLGRCYAIKLILNKKRTKKEIKDKLIEKEIEYQTIHQIIEQLEKDGYIDDVLYAKKLIKKMQQQNKSKKQVELEFLIKGLNDQECLDLLDEYNFDEVAAQKLFEKKFADKDLNDPKNKMKLYNFLKTKGFDYDIIRKYVKI